MNKGDGYVERQVSGWSRRYRDARTDDAGDYETADGLARRAPARRTSATA